MELFDTHFHFYGETTPVEYMRNIEAALLLAPQCDCGKVDRLNLMAVGGDYVESLRSLEFAQLIGHSWFGVGVHPHNAAAYLDGKDDFEFFSGHPRLKAVGELGLDYFYSYSDRDSQRKVFAEFLELALEWNLPAIVHLRDRDGSDAAYSDACELLTPFAGRGGRFVVHCFAGSAAWAVKFLELGGYCGTTGMVTFKMAENIRQVLKIIPDDRLLLETDSPYLAPVPHRGSENHPGFLVLIAARVAAERGCGIEDIAGITTANAKRFFNIEE